MSLDPSPYAPPPFPPRHGYSSGPNDPLAAAKRAGTLMLVIGGLILLLGACNTITSLIVPPQEMFQRQTAMFHNPAGQLQMSPETYRAIALAMDFATVLIGAVFIALSVGVRRGGVGSAIAAMVLDGFLILLGGLGALVCVVVGLASPPFFAVACLPGGGFALALWLMIWLVAAARGISTAAAMQAQYAAQYWQYQQSAQTPGGYGYSPFPPPSAPPTTEQSHDSSSPG